MSDLAITPLDDLTALTARGPDAAAFLQGQLSQDMDLLAQRGALLAGLHNAQGRCLALLRLFHLGSDQIVIALPTAIAERVRTYLARYVLRAKVRIEDGSSNWRLYGLTGTDAEAAAETRLHLPLNREGLRQLILAPRSESLPQGHIANRAEWRIEEIESGMPEVFEQTAGEFVAQMLNLDVIGAISFGKGCYTGQEIIARAHYRGQVKRRMQLFHTASTAPLQPGERIGLSDGRRAQVVMAESVGDGGQEFLAVTTPSGSGSTTPATADDQAAADAASRLQTTQMPLPYELPG